MDEKDEIEEKLQDIERQQISPAADFKITLDGARMSYEKTKDLFESVNKLNLKKLSPTNVSADVTKRNR